MTFNLKPLILFLIFVLFFASPAWSGTPLPNQEGEIPAPLDFDTRQASSYRFELTPLVGNYFGDKLNHSFTVGGNLQWNLTEGLGVTTNFGYGRANYDRTSALAATFVDNNLYLIDGGFVLTAPGAYRGKHGVVEIDFFTSIGGGILRINNSNHGAGYIGGGMKIRPRFKKIRWLAIQIEIRNYFTSVDNPAGSDFEDDLILRVGPTFLLPPEI